MKKTAIFAAGCFWGVEESFRKVKGVVSTRVGYIGGKTVNPTYEAVCSHTTGHAEAIEITYDSDEITYEQLLKVFWSIHNPTQIGGQGLDTGEQYRSSIFYDTEVEKTIAQKSKEQQDSSGKYKQKIQTEIVPKVEFYEAEEYHQQYIAKQKSF